MKMKRNHKRKPATTAESPERNKQQHAKQERQKGARRRGTMVRLLPGASRYQIEDDWSPSDLPSNGQKPIHDRANPPWQPSSSTHIKRVSHGYHKGTKRVLRRIGPDSRFSGEILRFSFLTTKTGVLIPGGVVTRTRQVVLPAKSIINYLAEQFGFQYTLVWPVPFGPSVNPTNFFLENQFSVF